MLIIVVTMFVVLFAFLAGGLWIGWTLAVTGTILLALFRDIPLDKLLAQYAWNILTTQELLAAARSSPPSPARRPPRRRSSAASRSPSC